MTVIVDIHSECCSLLSLGRIIWEKIRASHGFTFFGLESVSFLHINLLCIALFPCLPSYFVSLSLHSKLLLMSNHNFHSVSDWAIKTDSVKFSMWLAFLLLNYILDLFTVGDMVIQPMRIVDCTFPFLWACPWDQTAFGMIVTKAFLKIKTLVSLVQVS